jgi:hypothetical protein
MLRLMVTHISTLTPYQFQVPIRKNLLTLDVILPSFITNRHQSGEEVEGTKGEGPKSKLNLGQQSKEWVLWKSA